MQIKDLQLKRALRCVLIILLLCSAGMAKLYAQSFTVDDLNYSVNEDGVSVTVTGHVNGDWASGTLTIPESVIYDGTVFSVTMIGNGAFSWNEGLTGSLIIPNTVISIGDWAFAGCSGFNGSLIIPNTVTSIGEFTFAGCSRFETIIVGSDNTVYDSRENCNALIKTNTNELMLGCKNTIIPSSVTSIGYEAFFNCSGLTGDIVIPNSVTTIGRGAFNGCSGLTGSLTIPNSVTSIGYESFAYCNNLSTVYYNAVNCADVDEIFPGAMACYPFEGCGGSLVIGENVERIPSYMFFVSSFTGGLTIPNTVTTIGNGSFAGCGFTGNLTIPNSVTTIGNGSFAGCGFTGNLIIPNSVTTIGDNAFRYCTGFTGDLTIGNSVTSIGEEAFYNCTGFMGSLTIGSSVNEISYDAFRDCTGFSSIYSRNATPPTLASSYYGGVFYGVNHSIPVFVPCGSQTTYSHTEGWSEFTNYQGNPDKVLQLSVNNEMYGEVFITQYATCESDETTVHAEPYSGYVFINWTVGGMVVSTNADYTFQLTENINIVANFGVADVYVFNTYVDEDVYPMNTAIPIHGTVTSIGNAPVANLEVEIGITVMDWKRTLSAISDENGQFTALFEPLPLESGYYTVNSGQVGNNSTEVHDSFDIMGMTILEKTIEDMQVVNDYWILCDVIENIPKTGLVKIINRNSFALTNIQVNVLSAPTGCEFTFVPMDLAGLSEGYLTYTALGTMPTQGYEYQEVRLMATCDQGAEAMFTIWFYCEEAWGTLEVSPSSLNTTMTKGKSKTLDVTLTNNGTGATGAITVSLPNNMEWMSVVGGTTLPSLAVNESTTFTLRLSPSNDLPLGQFTGTIGINCEHSDGVSLPYTITAVSDENGALVVDVTDEFTTNTNNGNGPHVEGAEVTLTGYYSHDIVAHGYTGVDGVFSVDSITEGYYILNVSAERHSYYESTILVEAGVTKQMDVFLQYQGVSYSWVVEPTEIQDEYTIVLDMVFEMNVPVPVVTLGAPQRIPEFEDSYTFNYVITNHGLIDALNLTLYTPENEYYLFTALYDHIDTLHAQSTVEIPCVVTRKSNLTIGCGEWALSRVQYSYLSGEELMYNQAIAYTLLSESASCNQNLPSLGGGYGGYIGGGGYGGGSGSGGSGGGSGSGGSGGTGTGGHGAPSHPGHGGHGGNGGSGSGNSSTPLVYNQIPSVNVRVGVQFSQRLTMTREAFIGTFAVHNGHTSNAVTGIGLDFIIKDEEGNDRTNLFQISVDTLINVTGIDGDGTLAAGMDGVVKILFIPTREAAPADSVVYSFGGNFSFVDPWNSVSYTMNLLPAYLTVHPSPDLHIDYFVASNVYGDNLLTPEEEPTIPAELAVRIWNKGAGKAKNVILQTAKPVIVENSQGLTIEDFGLYGAYIDGIGVQIGLDSIVFGNIESGQAKVGEWLYTSPLFAHMVSYNAQVIHNNSFDNPKLSLVSHVGIHSLTHAIRSQANRTDDINDFLVDDVPDENNYPDTIYFSNGGKTSVGVVGSIGFDHYVNNHDTIVTLTINPLRIGWNYGETEDPGRNFYELVSCTRNNDNKIIPLSNVWQEAMIMPNSGDSIYVNKLRIVDTVSAVQTVTYTLVYASNPSEPSQLPIGAIDGLFSVSNSKKVYFSQGNLQYQASTDTWRFATNQNDHIGEGNANISQTYDGWIDLFGWGTSGYDHGAVCYQPWSTSQTDSDYYAYGDSQNSLYDQTGKADWGYNPIDNGGNQENKWRTLDYLEWNYIFNERTTISGIRYAKAEVDGIKGTIMLPDDWEEFYYSLNNTNDNQASFNSNTITASDWGTLEQHGAVFLPAAGFRDGVSAHFMNDRAWYWSSYHGSGNRSWAVSFGNDFLGLWSDARCSGHAVRLVMDVPLTSYTINTSTNPTEGGTITGAGTYNAGETCTLKAMTNSGYSFINWTKDGEQVSAETTYSFTVTENATYVANFSRNAFHFITAGTWSTASNWQGNALPKVTDEVFVDAPCQLDQNATVAALTVSNDQSLTLQSGKTLTVTGNLNNTAASGLVIEDGAQLVHNVANVQATVRKHITPFNGTDDDWHMIALPLTGSSNMESISHLLEGEYDLYGYDETMTYWRNQRTTGSDFTALEATKGYLYGNSAEVTLEFSGTLQNSSSTISVPLSFTNGVHLSGFNLVGNPFPCNAYLNKPYYVLDENGTGINPVAIPTTTPIPPCTAVFVKADGDGETVVFTRAVP